MSTTVRYEARTATGALIERYDLQGPAERRALYAAQQQGMKGAHVVMVTTVVDELRIYDPPAEPEPYVPSPPRGPILKTPIVNLQGGNP